MCRKPKPTKVSLNEKEWDTHVSFTVMSMAASGDGKYLLAATDKSRYNYHSVILAPLFHHHSVRRELCDLNFGGHGQANQSSMHKPSAKMDSRVSEVICVRGNCFVLFALYVCIREERELGEERDRDGEERKRLFHMFPCGIYPFFPVYKPGRVFAVKLSFKKKMGASISFCCRGHAYMMWRVVTLDANQFLVAMRDWRLFVVVVLGSAVVFTAAAITHLPDRFAFS